MGRMHVRVLALALLVGGALAAPAAAGESITGDYTLSGMRSDGSTYEGRARIVREGDELVLRALLDSGVPRVARADLAQKAGVWVFRLEGEATLEAGARAVGLATSLGAALSGEPSKLPASHRAPTGPVVQVRRAPNSPCLLARRLEGKKEVGRERLTPSAAGELAVVVHPPAQRRFVPHRADGPGISLRYALEPRGEAIDVSVEVRDRGGATVFRDELAALTDLGEGLTYTWEGRLPGLTGWADARRSPYSVIISARREGAVAAGEPVEVVAVPLVDACFVVSSVDRGPLTSAGKLVAHDADLRIVGVVRAVVAGARPSEPRRTERVYYVSDEVAPADRAQLEGLGGVRLERWDAELWSPLELHWQRVLPRGVHSPAYRETQNATRHTRNGEFTNVYSNGDREGSWIGRDTIEYLHEEAGIGPDPAPDPAPGTVRYRFDVDYAHPALQLGAAARPGSFGRRDETPTTATAIRSGLFPEDFSPDLAGAHPRIHRISRRGPRPEPLLSYLEAYRGVPWIFGSILSQSAGFVGYDCADLVLGAARHAGISRQGHTNAHNLCRLYTRNRGSHPVLGFDLLGNTVHAETGKRYVVPTGTATDEHARPGDVIFFDFNGDGRWSHTTVLWDAPSGTLDVTSTLVWAGHGPNASDGFVEGTLLRYALRPGTRMIIRRFP